MKKSDYKIDEEFQTLIPPLSNEEFKLLEQSIIDEGCRDPLVIWDNIILDGHNRFNICSKHSIIFKRVEKNFDNREDAKIWILNNQLGRRNLNEAQRIDVVDKLFGLQEKQDAKKRQGTRTDKKNNIVPNLGRSSIKLGKKAKVSKNTYFKGIKIKENNQKLWDKCLDGEVSIDKAHKEVVNEIKQQKRQQESKNAESLNIDDDEIDLRLGDFTTVFNDVSDKSIDLILTDPPYPIDFIEEWQKLGEFAKKKLKKNGFLVAYCGHKNLFESMKRLNKSLDFYWIFALVHSGNTKVIKFNYIEAGWKPILVYQNGYKKLDKKVKDVIGGTGREKDNHKWQQAEEELDYLINSFSKPGNIILDPFAGSGTTLIAVKKNNRIAYGAERDKTEYNLAKKRINDEF